MNFGEAFRDEIYIPLSTTVYPPTICTRSLSHRMLKTQYSNNVDNLLTLGVNRWIGDTCLSKDCKNREMMLVFGGFALLRFSLIVVSSLPVSSPPPTCPDSRCVCSAPPLLCCFFPQLNHIKDFSHPKSVFLCHFFLFFNADYYLEICFTLQNGTNQWDA